MRRLRRYWIAFEVKLKYPGWRLDWVRPNKAVLTSPEGERYLIAFSFWSWQCLVTWLVPAVIWMWGLWMAAIGLLMLWKG